MSIDKPIAIVGMNGRFPMADDVDELWSNLVKHKDCISEFPAERRQNGFVDSEATRWGGFIAGIDEFDAEFFNISPREAAQMDPQQRLLLQSVYSALNNAGYTPQDFAAKTSGLFVSVAPCEYPAFAQQENPSVFGFLGKLPSIAVNRLSYIFNLKGPSELVDTVCSSVFVAVNRAMTAIQSGECEQAVVAAANLIIDPQVSIAYDNLGHLSHDRHSHSFAPDACGYIRSEAVGAFLLKPLDKAEQDGDHIHALIIGSAVCHGGSGSSLTAPNQEGMQQAITDAYRSAGISPDKVTYIEAHGTASEFGDVAEIDAFKTTYARLCKDRQNKTSCYIGTVKPNIGHTETASGIAALSKVIKALQTKTLPGVSGFHELNDAISLEESVFCITSEHQNWESLTDESDNALPRRAALNSYGLGGVNAHILLQEYIPGSDKNIQTVSTLSSPTAQLAIFSARSMDCLEVVAAEMLRFLREELSLCFDDLIYTLQLGREAMTVRLAFIVSNEQELIQGLEQFLDMKSENPGAIPMFRSVTDEGNPNVRTVSQSNDEELSKECLLEKYLENLALQWVQGSAIDWHSEYSGKKMQRIVLPPYPFAKKSYWLSKQNETPINIVKEQSIEHFITKFMSRELGIAVEDMKPSMILKEQGIDSVLLLRMVRHFEEVFATRLTIKEILRHDTLQSLSLYLRKILNQNGQHKTNNSRVFTLSAGQKGLWSLQKTFPDISAYNVPLCFRIQELDVDLFRKALAFTIKQHPILNSVIHSDSGVPELYILDDHEFTIKEEYASKLNSKDLLAHIEEECRQPFIMDRDPLMRTSLFRQGDKEYIVLILMHHIITDGLSLLNLLNTLFKAYQVYSQGEEPLLNNQGVTYQDYIDWEAEMLSSPEAERQLAYWKKQLSGELPVLSLPVSRPRPDIQSFNGAAVSHELEATQAKLVRDFLGEQSFTPAVFFLALFKLLLYRYSNQNDIIVGVPAMGRPKQDYDQLAGYFMNMMALRSSLLPDKHFMDFIKEVQSSMVDGLDHTAYPFAALLSQLDCVVSHEYSPVFQAAYAWQNFSPLRAFEESLKNCPVINEAEYIQEIQQLGEYELNLEVSESDKGFKLCLKYNPDLFTADSMQSMLGHYLALLAQVLRDPNLPLQTYSYIDQVERDRLLNEWNATDRSYTKDKCVHQLFEEQALETPEATALVFAETSLSYRELEERSTKLAIRLQAKGIGQGAFVGICLQRSIDMVVTLLAVLKCGAAYVPLDPDYPIERIAYMLEDSAASLVITESSNPHKQALAEQASCLLVDEIGDDINSLEVTGLKRFVNASDLAYVIYTSGSTGQPKGVMITHQNVVNFLSSMQQQPGISAQDSLLAVTTISFDIAVLELFLPLISGACCHICPADSSNDADKLKQEIARARPSIMQATPSTWQMLFQSGWCNEQAIKILCGGEALPESLKQLFIQSHSEVWNMYGPTETTIWSAVHKLEKDKPVQIGRPIANTEIYILNDKELSGTGIPGELCIGGDGLALGYLNKEALTKERFIDNPFIEGAILYRTGDLARWSGDGNIEYLGRIDDQVKLRGYRIELGEIETRLTAHPQIKNSAVVLKQGKQNKQLVAYYIAADHEGIPEQKILRDYLKENLPAYMIPAFFIRLDEFPKTANGKLNRKELAGRKLRYQGEEASNFVPSHGHEDIEKQLLAIWEDILDIEGIDPKAGFFDAGGNSFTAVLVTSAMQERLHCDVAVTDLFKYGSARALSAHIAEYRRGQTSHPVSVRQDLNKVSARQTDKNQDYPDYYKDSIAIIGLSCQVPDANDANMFWQNLREGKESINSLTDEELKASGLPASIISHPDYIPIQAAIEGKELFDPAFFELSPKDAAIMDPQFRHLLMHSWKAMEDAAYVPGQTQDVSVFISTSNNFYQALLPDSVPEKYSVLENPDSYVAWLLAQAGTIPTMVSHKLGFTGPSMFVHSNCSSSLAGLYAAQQSLRTGESRFALVGAATISSSTDFGYIHQQGLNFSSDGHLKTFDSSADGMVVGEGVAVVVLKRAIDAIEDGDHVYALLRGVGVNNDGAQKAGFYAPSVSGQAQIINKVLANSGVDPESISYVEAHGTGTRLGDPIELAALTEAYRVYTDRQQYCAIGSVKPNIGHLDTAAGLAGLIKVILALSHREIPPSINYQEANPAINFKDSPFYVVDKLMPWQGTAPRRAALSSLGVGGTNVHAILEEYQAPSTAAVTDKVAYLVPLSAKDPERLREYAESLCVFLEQEDRTGIRLCDLAYTLHAGRASMEQRLCIVVDSIDGLIATLHSFIDGDLSGDKVFSGHEDKDGLSTVIGEGDLAPTIEAWIESGNLHKIAALWVEGIAIDWRRIFSDKVVRRISLPTYPFAKESYWLDIATEQDNVNTNHAVLHPLLHRNTSSLNQQRFSSIFSGREFFLDDHLVDGQRILPGVAYLEMVRAALQHSTDQLADDASNIRLKNIVWIRPIVVGEQAEQFHLRLLPGNNEQISFEVYSHPLAIDESDDEEFILHSQGTIEFVRKAAEVTHNLQDIKDNCNKEHIQGQKCYEHLEARGIVYRDRFRGVSELSTGQAQALVKLRLPQSMSDSAGQYLWHPSMLDSAVQAVVYFMDRHEMQAEGEQRKEPRPTLPFAINELEILGPCRNEMWAVIRYLDDSVNDSTAKVDIDLCDEDGNVCLRIKQFSRRVYEKQDQDNDALLILQPQWQEQPIENGQMPVLAERHIILCEPGEQAAALSNAIRTQVADAHCHIIHSDGKAIEERYDDCALEVFHITQKILNSRPKGSALIQLLVQDDNQKQLLAGLSGILKTAQQESSKFLGQLIIVDGIKKTDETVEQLQDSARSVFDTEISYKQNKRFIRQWSSLETDQQQSTFTWQDEGVYLISGGMGGLGLLFAKEIAECTQSAILYLTGRSVLSTTQEQQLQKLKETGIDIRYRQIDVSDKAAVDSLIDNITKEAGQLNGIIHAAGMIRDHYIIEKQAQDFRDVLLPKVSGLVYLDQASKDISLDFFVVFASVSGIFGNNGQVDYAAANAFMDYYISYRQELVALGQRQGRSLSFDWPLWLSGGMQIDAASKKLMFNNSGSKPMPAEKGLQAFYQGMSVDTQQLLVLHGDKELLQQAYLEQGETKIVSSEPVSQDDQETDEDQLKQKVQSLLIDAAVALLKLKRDNINIDTELNKFGFDSISLVNFGNKLNDDYQLSLTPTVFFEYPTIRGLAGYLIDEHRVVFDKFVEKKVRVVDDDVPNLSRSLLSKSTSSHKRFLPTSEPVSAERQTLDAEPVAIVGISGRFPMADDVEAFWQNLVEGRDCISEVPKDRWDWQALWGDPATEPNKTNIKWGGFAEGIDQFDPLFFDISPREAKLMDPQQRLLMLHAWNAIEDAGYAAQSLAGSQTGIFVGTNCTGYADLLKQANIPLEAYSSTGGVSSMTANRMSYFLDIHGPSEPIDTACSSSLIAIHRAHTAINSGRCDMAIAGGVYTMVVPDLHISFSKAGMLCEDGRCKTFSAQANGYVRGEGVGMLLLKRLSQAERDRDHIYAVIRGSAENHGGRANSLTAPNPKAQAALLEAAYTQAGIDPRTVTYIEAHGTGTELGDPIEIQGLKSAFSRLYKKSGSTVEQEEARCALGSVKSNIGHLEFAAGVAGVIKVLLQLKHKRLVKSLHCEELNPYIQLEDSPFYILQEARDWTALKDKQGNVLPRRAGVSSFGFGGVNAHVVLEEYIAPETSMDFEPGPKMILLSAKDESRLRERAAQLLAVLESKEAGDADLDAIAYTLQVGREHMQQRLALIVSGASELTEKLKAYLQGETAIDDFYTGRAKENNDNLQLFNDDGELQEAIAKWIARGKYVRLLELWVQGLTFDWQKLYSEGQRPRRLSLPVYPFARDRYWVPEENNKDIRSEVAAQSALLHPLLHRNTSDLHSEQRFTSVFNGEEFFLADHVVSGNKVLPAVAYLEMVRAAIEQAGGLKADSDDKIRLQQVVWIRPIIADSQATRIQIGLYPEQDGAISFEVYSEIEHQGAAENKTCIHCQGRAIIISAQAAEILNITQLRSGFDQDSVMVKDCYALLKKRGLNIGPALRGIKDLKVKQGQVLAQLQLPDCVCDTLNDYVLHPGLMDLALQAPIALALGDKKRLSTLVLPFALCDFDILGPCSRDMWVWVRYSEGSGPDDQIQDMDIDLCDEQGRICARFNGISFRVYEAEAKSNIMLWQPQWKSVNATNGSNSNYSQRHVCLIGNKALGTYQQLSTALTDVHSHHFQSSSSAVDQQYEDYVLQSVSLIKSILEEKSKGEILIQLLCEKENLLIQGLTVLLKTAEQEHSSLKGQLIIVEDFDDSDRLIEQIYESAADQLNRVIRYHAGEAKSVEWQKTRLSEEISPPWKEQGVYLLSGGAGGLGLLFAEEISKRIKKASLILLGRSELNTDQQARLDAIRQSDAVVDYRQVDITDSAALESLLQAIRKDYGSLNGIIHSAGNVHDSYILNKDEKQIKTVLAPKVSGLVNLDELTQDLPLDFFVVFSSIAAVTGHAGQIDYAAANAFMDNYMMYRYDLQIQGKRHGQSLSLNWPLWKDGGMAMDSATQTMLRSSTGMMAMATDKGMQAFYAALSLDVPQVLISSGDAEKTEQILNPSIKDKAAISVAHTGKSTDSNSAALTQKLQEALINTIAAMQHLKRDDIDPEMQLDKFGLDSIALTEFGNTLNKTYGLSLTPTIFFEHSTIALLNAYLVDEYRELFMKEFAVSAESPAVELGTINIKPEQHSATTKRRSRLSANVLPYRTKIQQNTAAEPIAIVGVSGRFPMADDINAFWQNLVDGRDCISEIPEDRWDWQALWGDPDSQANKSNIKWGGFIEGVDEFDPLFFGISPREAEVMDPQQRLLMLYAWKAIEDAGYAAQDLAGSRTALFAGTAGTGYSELVSRSGLDIEGYSSTGTVVSVGPNRMSYFLDIHGPSEPIDTACSSALVAIHRAVSAINQGQCELALAGGINTIISSSLHISFSKAGMLCEDGRCKTFSAQANGYVRGEGVGMLLLKRLSQAERDKDHIYAVIRGSAENHGGRAKSLTAPNPKAQAALLEAAYTQAGIDPRTVTYIEAHGTGTELGDPIEIDGLKSAFKQLYRNTEIEQETEQKNAHCGIGSVKTNIGHLELAAGVAGVIKVLLQLKHKRLVKSLHCEELNPYIQLEDSPFYILKEARDWTALKDKQGNVLPRRAGVSSFGFGGVNAHVVLEEYIATDAVVEIVPGPRMIVLSAKDDTRLRESAKQLLAVLEDDADLAAIAYTLQLGREHMPQRLAVIANTVSDLREKLTAYLQGDELIPDLYIGNTRTGKQSVSSFNNDEDMLQIQDNWLAKAKYGKFLDLWVQGLAFDWMKLYEEGKQPRRLSLPTYPFAKDAYWVPTQSQDMSAPVQAKRNTEDTKRHLLIKKHWQHSPGTFKEDIDAIEQAQGFICKENIIALTSKETSAIADKLKTYFPNIKPLELAKDNEIKLEDYSGYIDLVACGTEVDRSLGWIEGLQAFIEARHRDGAKLLCITTGLESLSQQSNLTGADRAGLYRMLQAEYKRIKTRHVDIDPDTDAESLAALIALEYQFNSNDIEVSYAEGKRYCATLQETEFKLFSTEQGALPFSDSDVLLITGGTRGLGYLCARHFVETHGVKRIVLSGKEALPAKDQWATCLAEKNIDEQILNKITAIQALEKLGAQVQVLSIDLNDEPALDKALQDIRDSLGPVTALIHCAGSASSGNPVFMSKSVESMSAVISPKTTAVDHLMRQLDPASLRFAVFFSSVSAGIPALAAAQSDYALANSYMDYIALHWHKQAAVCSIQWPSWSESGMGEARTPAYQNSGLLSLSDQQGLAFLDYILMNKSGPVIMPAIVDPERWQIGSLMQYTGDVAAVADSTKAVTTPAVSQWLKTLFSTELKIDKTMLDVDVPIQDYGVDSILLMQVLRKLNQLLAIDLDPSVLYEHTSIAALAAYLLNTQAKALAVVLNTADTMQDAPVKLLQIKQAAVPRRDSSKDTPVDIAVVGMSCRFPGAASLEQYWDLLATGRCAIEQVPTSRWQQNNDYYAGLLADIRRFDPDYFLIPKEDARIMDPQALLILEESLKLFYHAGYEHEAIRGRDIGVYIGARSLHQPDGSALELSRNPIVAAGQNYLAANVSQFFDLRGPGLVIDTACSSALSGMHMAVQALRNAEISAAVVGGVNVLADDNIHSLFQKRGLLSKDADFHVFDGRADGIVPAEGVGLVLLKTLEQAQTDGDHIYAVVKAIAINNDGRTVGPATPNIEAQKEVMRNALHRSGKTADDISYIEVNGSGSEITDLLELKAIESVYRSGTHGDCYLGSLKPNIGHPLCAEGIAAFIKVALMLQHRQTVPFLSAKEAMPHYDLASSPFRFYRESLDWDSAQPLAALNSFADGGTNAHVILETCDEQANNTRNPLSVPALKPYDVYTTEIIELSELRAQKNAQDKETKEKSWWEASVVNNWWEH